MGFKPANDNEIRYACGLRINHSKDYDERPWIGSDSAWDAYIDKLDELDPKGIINNQNELQNAN